MTVTKSRNSLEDSSSASFSSSSCSLLDEGVTGDVPRHSHDIPDGDRELVARLREMVQADLTNYYDTDFNMLRWLQGNRELPLEQVARKLRAHLKMRKSSWNLDKIAQKPRKHSIHKHWIYGITGESKKLENVIVNVEQIGHTDFSGMLETHSVQQVLKARTQDMEDMLARVMQLEAKTGKQAWVLFVLDMTGLKYDKRLLQLIRGGMRALTEYMATHYVELVRILSAANWREEILKYSTPEVLPAKWNTNNSMNFKAELEYPPPYAPDNYHKLKNKEQNTNGMEKLKIAAGTTFVITKEVKKGETLEWFLLADSDFGMGVYHTANKDETNFERMDVAYPCLEWMPSGPTECPVSDYVRASEDGFFKVWLSNQHAWWTTLIIRARLNVLPADLD